MKMGIFNKNNTASGTYWFYKMFEEQTGTEAFYVDSLSLLDTIEEYRLIDKNDPEDLDVLVVCPNLNPKQWDMLQNYVKRYPKIRFVFFLTPFSADIFAERQFALFPNVKAYKSFKEQYEEALLLITEAQKTT
ncbi:MAG: hypothetical protein WCT26_04675 [Candidatus Buchananbacteria bacterium]|jgi:hypothetical protein